MLRNSLVVTKALPNALWLNSARLHMLIVGFLIRGDTCAYLGTEL